MAKEAPEKTEEMDDLPEVVTQEITDAQLSDLEGRDRTDANELQSRVDAKKLVETNLSDQEMRRATIRVAPDYGEEESKLSAAEKKRLERFAKLAHVKVSDILAFNQNTLIGVTGFGGKYQMNRKGTQLRHLAGPVPVGVESEQEMRLQERLEREMNAAAR